MLDFEGVGNYPLLRCAQHQFTQCGYVIIPFTTLEGSNVGSVYCTVT